MDAGNQQNDNVFTGGMLDTNEDVNYVETIIFRLQTLGKE